MQRDWRLAVDIGGTFTDIVLMDALSGELVVEKTLTTSSKPLDAVRTGVGRLLARANVLPSDITAPIVHATTLITNALIEAKTGRAALVTTKGFADTLLIRDEHRYDMYDLQIEFPQPPVPRSLTFEIDERTNAAGIVLVEPEPAELNRLAKSIAEANVEAVAVCLLNSYVNGANENTVARHLENELGVPVCVSSQISPQIREYPRMVTTAANAATMPIIGPYLDELQKWLSAEGFGGSVLMMLSNGGVVSADEAARGPIRLVESGPAAGALAGSWFAKRNNEARLLCFDMGGTTAKACLIEHGEPALTTSFEVARSYRFKKGSGFPVSVPSVDLVEIGAGGGSIADVDHFDLLKVGPESAGADPGPACYGAGGTAATVTDADVTLGLVDPDSFLGGDMALSAPLAEAAIGEVATKLDMTAVETAAGIHEVVNQNMAAAARMHAVEMGVDLRGVTVLAFGGAGPVHACRVAEILQSSRVIFPVNASVLSAFGTLVSPVRIDLARSLPRLISTLDPSERDTLLDQLREEGSRVLTAAGVPHDAIVFRYGVDARYAGQGNEITIWVGEGEHWPATPEQLHDAFEAEYRRIYGLTIPDVDIEGVTWRLSARADTTVTASATAPPSHETVAPSHREIVFDRGGSAIVAAVHQRSTLAADTRVVGPSVVEERETTSVIPPGWVAHVTPDGALIAERTVAS